MYQTIKSLLDVNGILAQNWPGYEMRQGQLQMAKEICRAFQEDDITLIEAGTGTGKTLAYLLPALLSGKKTLVSTGLKNLQDQIFEKDIPFIKKFFGSGFKAARLKGRENYLCLYFLKQYLTQIELLNPEDKKIFLEIKTWAQISKNGDKADMPFVVSPFLWASLSASAERCLGQRCPDFEDCFLWAARKNAVAADLLIVNHHLFMADLAIKNKGFGEVIPNCEALIFDEAHLLEETATYYFGLHLSTSALNSLKSDLQKVFSIFQKLSPNFKKLFNIWSNQAEALGKHFYKNISEQELWQKNDPEALPLKEFLNGFYIDTFNLAELINNHCHENEELKVYGKRLKDISETMYFISEATDLNYVYQVERQGHRLTFSAYPIKVNNIFTQNITNKPQPIIFTSATLSSSGDFSYFKEHLGILPEAQSLEIKSPFNYQKQTLTYVDSNLPFPNSENFTEEITKKIEEILNLSQGRALILFTSYKNMNYVYKHLVNDIKFPIYIQEEQSKQKLLEIFQKETNSVLLATYSFWQGVDIPGEALSVLIIEKLPFPRPDRPLVKAQCQLLEHENRNAFFEYYIPETIITLKQGFGRLMRKNTDKGLIAILDNRLIKKNYGKKILKALPPSTISNNFEDVKNFLKTI